MNEKNAPDEKQNSDNGKETPTISFYDLPNETQMVLRKLQVKYVISQQYHNTYFGYSPSISSVDAFGRQLVAIGGSIVHSDDPDNEWKIPSDFLLSYLKDRLGSAWLEQEFKKDYKDQHDIAKWCSRGISNLDKESSEYWGKPNGKALALLHLAYDLYVLESIGSLPGNIIERLKVRQNFNGVRYEIFVFATLVRAGFEISYMDERSGLHGRVPECLATHLATKVQVHVEAKTRNVKNVLGSVQGTSRKIRLYDKIKNAIEKNVKGPYFIFIEVNHPYIKAEMGNRELEKIRSEYRKIEARYKESMPNLVCVTNIPFHYGADNSSPKRNLIGLLIPKNPKYRMSFNQKILTDMYASLKKYDFLPKEFNQSDIYANNAVESQIHNNPIK